MHNTFSIITVVKNDAMRLKKTLHSIFSQEYDVHAIQSIIIDGASQDEVEEVCSLFPDIDTYISEVDDGIYDAMNKGMAHAKNKWVMFLNAGDVFAHTMILSEIDVQITRHSTASIMCGSTRECFKNNTIIRKSRSIKSMPIHLPASHQSMIYRLDVLTQYPFDTTYKICSDLEQFARILRDETHTICYMPIVCTEVNAEGYSTHNVKRALKERRLIQKKYFNTPIFSMRMTVFIGMYYIKRFLKRVLPLSTIHTLQNKMYNKK